MFRLNLQACFRGGGRRHREDAFRQYPDLFAAVSRVVGWFSRLIAKLTQEVGPLTDEILMQRG